VHAREAGDGGQGIGRRLRGSFEQWVIRRIPPARSVTLDQRRIFIFPSRAGLFFGLCLLVMLLTAINYENNMAYALTFLLAMLFVVATLHTYANLSGLTIRALRAKPAFPGQQSEFDLMIERGNRRGHYALHLGWINSTDALVNLGEEERLQVRLHAAVGERGWYSPGRLLLESTYPLGLLRCWTRIDLDLCALVYPRPLAAPRPAGLAQESPEGAPVPVTGSDDFYGLRDYRRGDSLRHIHWKGLARGQGLQSKQYAACADRSAWLAWEMFPATDTERRLSHLCYWALAFEERNEEYGLRLPGVVIEPGRGDKHRERVLQELALYGKERRAP
jgi:uncharacterized protein (DUF58 family)